MTERPAPIHVPFRLGGILVDPGRGTLTRGEMNRRVEPRVMDVLCTLAARAGEGVRREALLQQHRADDRPKGIAIPRLEQFLL